MLERKSLRLPEYDYSRPGMYYVTIVTHQRKQIFGHVTNTLMIKNAFGDIAHGILTNLPNHFPIHLDEFIIMPNHIHAIIEIVGARFIAPGASVTGASVTGASKSFVIPTPINNKPRGGATGKCNPMGTYRLGAIIRRFKGRTTFEINNIPFTIKPDAVRRAGVVRRGTTRQVGAMNRAPTVWQRNYYEHVIRDAYDLNRIREYIRNNPKEWENDELCE